MIRLGKLIISHSACTVQSWEKHEGEDLKGHLTILLIPELYVPNTLNPPNTQPILYMRGQRLGRVK